MATRTGGFPIGFRRGWSDWQKNDLASLAKWAKSTGFDGIDLGRVTAADVGILHAAGLKLGSGDLVDHGDLVSADRGRRRDAVGKVVAYVDAAAAAGTRAFFLVIIPDPAIRKSDAYDYAVEGYTPVAQAAAKHGASLAIEGWPGGSPHLPALCCTPETVRRFMHDVGGSGIGLNYDPSHLIRLGVDHIRFLREFAPYVRHVHGKDTQLNTEAAYEYGIYQPAAFAKPHGFGEHAWRYTLPGHGVARWTDSFEILKEHGYNGFVSVELEDENFNGSEQGERDGLIHSLNYLRSV